MMLTDVDETVLYSGTIVVVLDTYKLIKSGTVTVTDAQLVFSDGCILSELTYEEAVGCHERGDIVFDWGDDFKGFWIDVC